MEGIVMEDRSAFVQEIHTECKINAPVEKVYAVLSDFAHYAAWTDEITVSGDTRPGGKMRVKVKTAKDGKGWYSMSSRMRQHDKHLIAFDNVMGAPFLFLGRHSFELIPLSDGKTMFINAEVFSGLLVPFVRKKNLLGATQRFKEKMNLALKRAVEEKAAGAVKEPASKPEAK